MTQVAENSVKISFSLPFSIFPPFPHIFIYVIEISKDCVWEREGMCSNDRCFDASEHQAGG